jgi:hypothetical protein
MAIWVAARVKTLRSTCHGEAPSAVRIPISRRRCVTASDMSA